MAINEKLLEIHQLGFRYPQKEVFRNIDLNVEEGRMFTLLGPNGCGKTTLIHCILNYLKAQEGEISIDGRRLEQIKPADLARLISYVPQNHKKVFPYTVREVVLMGRAAYVPAYSSPKKEDLRIAEEALELLGIADLADRPYPFLSGGESQLVILARSIAQRSRMIILDEPTAHLDSYHELMVLDKLALLMKETNLTIFMTTHFPNQALYLMNHGVPVHGALMKKGRILSEGFGEAIFSAENISELYDINCRLIEIEDPPGNQIRQLVPLGIQDGWPQENKKSDGAREEA